MKAGKISSTTVLPFFALECIGPYIFKDEIKRPSTHVKNQPITGTCWSLSITSFIESAILKTGQKKFYISPRMNVRIACYQKARSYVMRQWEDRRGVFIFGALQVMKTTK